MAKKQDDMSSALRSVKSVLRKGNVHPVPKGMKLDKSPQTYRRDLLYNWIQGISCQDLREIRELENMFLLLKGTADDILYEKLIQKKEWSAKDLAHFKLMKEVLVDLQKIKYGEKRVNVNVGYKDIHEMMFSDFRKDKKDANPPNK